jgi:hypothetical protein
VTGLVLIENATLRGLNDDGTPGDYCAKAFAYRSHSGFFGIVNSEEAYQNLTRFLFGDVRVDVYLDVEDIRLPEELKAAEKKHKVNALYQIEMHAAARGKLWYLTRRMAEEDSVSCFTHADWKKDRTHYLSSVFLANYARVNKRRRSLAYQMMLGVRVPDYEVDKKLWINEHYEGGYLFPELPGSRDHAAAREGRQVEGVLRVAGRGHEQGRHRGGRRQDRCRQARDRDPVRKPRDRRGRAAAAEYARHQGGAAVGGVSLELTMSPGFGAWLQPICECFSVKKSLRGAAFPRAASTMWRAAGPGVPGHRARPGSAAVITCYRHGSNDRRAVGESLERTGPKAFLTENGWRPGVGRRWLSGAIIGH